MICHCHRTPKLAHEPRNPTPTTTRPEPSSTAGLQAGARLETLSLGMLLGNTRGSPSLKAGVVCVCVCVCARMCVCLCVCVCDRLAIVWECLSINFSGCAAPESANQLRMWKSKTSPRCFRGQEPALRRGHSCRCRKLEPKRARLEVYDWGLEPLPIPRCMINPGSRKSSLNPQPRCAAFALQL